MKKINVRLLLRFVHRDLGFLFFGLTIVYAVSGIALNHRDQWDPNYIIVQQTHQVARIPEQPMTREQAIAFLGDFNLERGFKRSFQPNDRTVRFFVADGTVELNLQTGIMEVELIRRRPIFHTFNKLHYNPKMGWTWFADIFAAGLIVLAVTGLFIVRGKYGITRRGGIWLAVGIVAPALFVYFVL